MTPILQQSYSTRYDSLLPLLAIAGYSVAGSIPVTDIISGGKPRWGCPPEMELVTGIEPATV
jgi:hypothetical protein